MLIHGKLILTANGFLLDEVRSLLQKSLRRKEHDLVWQSAKELIGCGKDQLPWKSLVTFLFEDHCLNGWAAVNVLYKKVVNKDKYGALKLLLQCHTCRVACCLPVVTLDEQYHPVNWDPSVSPPDELSGLMEKRSHTIDCDLLLCHLDKAWKEQNTHDLMTYMKLASMVYDIEKRAVTRKGINYILEQIPAKCDKFSTNSFQPHIGLVILTMLYKSAPNCSLKSYTYSCFKLSAAVADVPVRLILFGVVAQVMYKEQSEKLEFLQAPRISVNQVDRLSKMPSWAVDKHTFRGKHGKGTRHLVKKKPEWMTREQYEEFHGERPKRGLQHFFDHGCVCVSEALQDNPYWVRTKEIYFSKPHRQQKTVHMTAVYYKELTAKYPVVLYKSKRNVSGAESQSSSDVDKQALLVMFEQGRVTRGRFKAFQEAESLSKSGDRKRKLTDKCGGDEDEDEAGPGRGNTNGLLKSNPGKKKAKLAPKCCEGIGTIPVTGPKGPLLQLPTGSAKVYTSLEMSTKRVWKGPFREGKLEFVVFLHKAMRDVLGDPHTLNVEVDAPYVTFPLLRAPGAAVEVTKKDFYDCIGKKRVSEGEFILRESLGVIQLHKLSAGEIEKLPMSIWAHFIYRFALNVGDSGLYNAVTDKGHTFLYGIDMEEFRKNVHGRELINMMFVKLPSKPLCVAIINSVKENKAGLMQILKQDVNYARLDSLAASWGATYDRTLFVKRIVSARHVLVKL